MSSIADVKNHICICPTCGHHHDPLHVAKSIEGQRKRAESFKAVNNSAPFGYRINEDGYLYIYEPEAQLVREIFAKYLELKNAPDVLSHFKGRVPLSLHTLSEMRNNRIYVGDLELMGNTKHFDELQIIDSDTLHRVRQLKMHSNERPMPQERKQIVLDKVEGKLKKFIESNGHKFDYDLWMGTVKPNGSSEVGTAKTFGEIATVLDRITMLKHLDEVIKLCKEALMPTPFTTGLRKSRSVIAIAIVCVALSSYNYGLTKEGLARLMDEDVEDVIICIDRLKTKLLTG